MLIVDDFEPWRSHVSGLLSKPGLSESTPIEVHEAADGDEALAAAERLKPDLILLDIGLPKLNGMQVIRSLRARHCTSIIMMVTNQVDLEVVEAALAAGALGYVLKSDGSELITGIKAVLNGQTFLSAGVAKVLLAAGVAKVSAGAQEDDRAQQNATAQDDYKAQQDRADGPND